MESLRGKRIGFAITASYCTFDAILAPLLQLVSEGADVTPILSFNASLYDSRFHNAEKYKEKLREITGNQIIDTIAAAEPIGPKKLLDLIVVAPCTGNTLAKLSNGITDTPVTMACKAHMRNERPVVLAISTNDGLAANAENIGRLLNTKGYYFVPFRQDDCSNKPSSIIADMNKIANTIEKALENTQLQPILS